MSEVDSTGVAYGTRVGTTTRQDKSAANIRVRYKNIRTLRIAPIIAQCYFLPTKAGKIVFLEPIPK